MTERDIPCNGCTICAMRCTAGIRMSNAEYTHIVEELRNQNQRFIRRVLNQEKELFWFEEITYTACLFLDIETRLCAIYPARPLICRLFGHVAHLPCPIEKVPVSLDADELLTAYTSQPLHTFQEWMMINNIFNFEDLLGTPYEPPIYEV